MIVYWDTLAQFRNTRFKFPALLAIWLFLNCSWPIFGPGDYHNPKTGRNACWYINLYQMIVDGHLGCFGTIFRHQIGYLGFTSAAQMAFLIYSWPTSSARYHHKPKTCFLQHMLAYQFPSYMIIDSRWRCRDTISRQRIRYYKFWGKSTIFSICLTAICPEKNIHPNMDQNTYRFISFHHVWP